MVKVEIRPNEMATLRTIVTLEEIKQIVPQLVSALRGFCPRKVILFGSYAYGSPHEGSDIDLLVVLPDHLSRQEAQKVVHELREQFSLPIQIFFISSEEFEETKEVVGGIAYPAHTWGKVLYEANP